MGTNGVHTLAINRHGLRQTGGQTSAGQVPKLGAAAQGTAGGSAHEGGTLVLLQAEDGGPSMLAAEALVPGMLPQ